MRHTVTAVALLLITLSLAASPLSDARASLAQLRRAITNRDGVLLTDLVGPNRFRSGGAIRWSDVEEYVAQAEAIIKSPVRTVSGETSVGQPQFAVIGWDGDVLYAARFLKDAKNRWLLAKIHLGARTRTAADRQAFEAYIKKVPEARLVDGFFRGNSSTLGKLVDELEGLRAEAPAAADSLDQLLTRYRSVWHAHACAVIATVYDPRVTWTDVTNGLAFNYASLERFCVKSCQPRPELTLHLLEQTATSGGITARLRNDNADSGWSWDTTLTIVKVDGKYRIVREEHTNHRPRKG